MEWLQRDVAYMDRHLAHWALTQPHTTLPCVHVVETDYQLAYHTHHSYADKQEATSDWQGSCSPDVAIYGGESERLRDENEEYQQGDTGSIYITPCSTCGLLSRAKNRIFWGNPLAWPMYDQKCAGVCVALRVEGIAMCASLQISVRICVCV